MRYSLDTNIIISLMSGRNPELRERIAVRFNDGIGVSSLVMFELMFGAYNSARVAQNRERLTRLAFPILDFDADDAKSAGAIRAQLKRVGMSIGPYDLLIAGQAKARGLVLITNNRSEFARVDGLQIEDWTQMGA